MRDRDGCALPAQSKLSLDQMIHLGQAADASFIAGARTALDLEETVASMLKAVVHPVLAEYQWLGPVNGENDSTNLKDSMDYAEAWGRACFGIGVEQGLGTLSIKRGVRYLARVCAAYGAYAGQLLLQRAGYAVCTDGSAFGRAKLMLVQVRWWGIRAWNVGYEACMTIERVDDGFLKALDLVGKTEGGQG